MKQARWLQLSLHESVHVALIVNLLEDQFTSIVIQPTYSESLQYVQQIQERLLEEVSTFRNEDIRENRVDAVVLPADPSKHSQAERSSGELRFSEVRALVRRRREA